MSPDPDKATPPHPISRVTAANVFAEMLAWMDRCEAAEAENAILKARVAAQAAEIEALKEPAEGVHEAP